MDVSFESLEQGQAKCKLTCKFAYCERSLKAQKDFRSINMSAWKRKKQRETNKTK